MVCQANLMAQSVTADFKFGGGKKEQKETKTIHISDFSVSQLVRKKGTAKSGGGIGGNMAFAHMTVDFGGVDPNAYQQMLTEVYDELGKKLTSLGYKVLTGDEVKSKTSRNCEIVNTVEEPKQNNAVNAQVVRIRPKDKLLCFTDNIISNGLMAAKVARDVDAIVLNFNYTIDYVNYGKSGGAFSKKAKIEAEPNLAFSGFMSTTVSKGGGISYLKPVKADDSWVGSEGMYQTSNRKVVSPLFGMGASSSSSKWTLDVDQAKFLSTVKSYLLAAANASVDAWQTELK
jgi:hypothetical protein